ncbi:MAG TPA: hypothetical protein VFL79_10605 [Terriglobia bacterium]|nr:hypothetical protein [Terriglobia bacterium]
MRDVLRAVAGFSGVELPGLPSNLQSDKTPSPSLDIKTLKDRFRNDLEGFSLKTTQELANRAREQTRAALEAVQNEVGGMVDHVAAEFRENLHLPAQIEKLLEPCVEDAEARLANSVSREFDQLVTRHEKLVQEKLQETLRSVHAQMSALEQAVQQIRDLEAQSAAEPPSQQPGAEADFERVLAEHDRSVQGRLHEAVAPVQAQIGTLEETVQQLLEFKAQSAAQSSADQMSTAEVAGRIDELAAEVRGKLLDHAQFEKLFEPQFEEAAARLENSITQKVEQLVARHELMVQEKLQETLSSVSGQMGTLEQTMQEVRDVRADLLAQANAELRDTAEETEHLLAEHDRLVQGRLQEALIPVQAQMNALEQTMLEVRELKAERVVQASAQQPGTAELAGRIDQLAAEFRERLQDQTHIDKLMGPRIGEAAARLEKSICQKVEDLVARHEQLVQERLNGTMITVQAQMSALEQTVKAIRVLQAESVMQLSAEQPVGSAGDPMKVNESPLNNGLKDFLEQSFSRIESSFNNLREARKVQSVQSSSTGLEYLRKVIPAGSPDMLMRVQQALDNLDRLGPKDPIPAI